MIGVESLLNSIIPALQELNNDKNWRIRKATIEHLAFFAKQIGAQFFSSQIIKLLLTCINDKVYSVRFPEKLYFIFLNIKNFDDLLVN